MTDDARNHEDSGGDNRGRAAGPAQEPAAPAQEPAAPAQASAEPAQEPAGPAQVSAEPAQESVPLPARARRRWFQCSLRTILLGTALIACELGRFVRKVDRAGRAVAAIEEVGAFWACAGRSRDPGKIEAWLRRRLPPAYFDDVIIVHADHNAQITDTVAAHLSALTSLEQLDLRGTRVTDAGVAHLSALTSLHYLYLSGTQVSDAGLAHFPALRVAGRALSQRDERDLRGRDYAEEEATEVIRNNKVTAPRTESVLIGKLADPPAAECLRGWRSSAEPASSVPGIARTQFARVLSGSGWVHLLAPASALTRPARFAPDQPSPKFLPIENASDLAYTLVCRNYPSSPIIPRLQFHETPGRAFPAILCCATP